MAWTAETILTSIGQHAPTECITEARLVELTGMTAKQVENACQNLRRHSFITRTGQGCHKLTQAGRNAIAQGKTVRSGPQGTRQTGHRRKAGGMRQRIWNCLRTGKKLTIDDIIMRVVDEEDEGDARSNVRKYVVALSKAGYAKAMEIREPALNLTSNGCKRWWLISDTGPDAPVVRISRKMLWDPNLEMEIAMAREIQA